MASSGVNPALLKQVEQVVELRNQIEANIAKLDLTQATVEQQLGLVEDDDLDDLADVLKEVQLSLDNGLAMSDPLVLLLTSFLSQIRQTSILCNKFGPSFGKMVTMASVTEQLYDLERQFAELIQKVDVFRKKFHALTSDPIPEDFQLPSAMQPVPADMQYKINKATDIICRKVMEATKRVVHFQRRINLLRSLNDSQIPPDFEEELNSTIGNLKQLELFVDDEKSLIETSQNLNSSNQKYEQIAKNLLANVSANPCPLRVVGAPILTGKQPSAPKTVIPKVSDEKIAQQFAPKKAPELKPLCLSQQAPTVVQLVIQTAEPTPPAPCAEALAPKPSAVSSDVAPKLVAPPPPKPPQLAAPAPEPPAATPVPSPPVVSLLSEAVTSAIFVVPTSSVVTSHAGSAAAVLTASSVAEAPQTSVPDSKPAVTAPPTSTAPTSMLSFAPKTTTVTTTVSSSGTTSAFSFTPFAPKPTTTVSNQGFGSFGQTATTAQPQQPQPTTTQSSSFSFAPKPVQAQPQPAQGQDENMEDGAQNGGTNSGFSFKNTGLGGAPQNKTAGGFGGINFANVAQKPSIFGGFGSTKPSTGFGSLAQAAPQQPTPSMFGGGSSASSASAFGAGPSFGSGSAFGKPSAPQSVFGGKSIFGSGPQSSSTQPASTGFGSTTGGFASFANKASSFGQLAQSGSPSMFGGGPTSTGFPQTNTSFGSASSSGFGQAQDPAFTVFRK